MNAFELDDDQRMLTDSARTYTARGYGAAQQAESAAHALGCVPARWDELAGMGWLALPVPEDADGLGGSLADICVLAEELGRALVVEPFIASAVLAGMLLADAAPPAVRAQWLPLLAAGNKRVALAAWEPGARFDVSCDGAIAEQLGEVWRISGDKALAPGGAGADAWLFAARIAVEGAGSATPQAGLFLAEAGAPGLHATPFALYDGQHAATLRLDGVTAVTLLESGPVAEVLGRIETALDRACVAHCAETVGVMARALEITRGYVSTRKQFNRTIASNQVIQHRLVDLYVEIEEARAITRAAALAWGVDDAGQNMAATRRRYSAAAKACVAAAACHTWEESIQLHGAIGMTEEYEVGRYVRRLALASSLYGDAHFHLERLASLSFDEPTFTAPTARQGSQHAAQLA